MKQDLQAKADDLKQARDELRVEMHLAAAEIRDDWETLEKEWAHFSDKLKRASHETAEASEGVGEALSLLGDELKKGYERIRKAM